MKRILIFLAILVTLLPYFLAARAEKGSVSYPSVLPGSPLYFFKSLGRGIRKVFALSPQAKVELDLKVAAEKAKEIAALIRRKSEKENFEYAFADYEKKLGSILEKLESIRENRARHDGLVKSFLVSIIDGQMLLEKLKVEAGMEWGDEIEAVQAGLDRVAIGALRRSGGDAKRYLSVVNNRDRKLSDAFWVIYVLNRWEKEASADVDVSAKLLVAKRDFVLRLEGFLRAASEDELAGFLRELRIDFPDQLIALEEVRELFTDPDLKSRLNIVRQTNLEALDEKGLLGKEEAEKMISLADFKVSELEAKLASENPKPNDIKRLLEQAQINLEQARKLFAENRFSSAIGQGLASRAVAGSGLLLYLEKSKILNENSDNRDLRIEFDRLKERAKAAGETPESNPSLYSLFDQAEKFMIAAKNTDEVKQSKILLGEIEATLFKGQ